ncbi:hypothetical protein AJ80_03763 [Polytolypa hystricis UAMH7299]|uniref:Uncharacterized protein n=1 Tax=Polytolypa hystricis (strain UAMH7299) TaxID=1447883 RepID=A0A2B7YE81_POLH7|nr:hypothetical protein AJ80_03763 [Polytolypa hystricis UAMH7299]
MSTATDLQVESHTYSNATTNKQHPSSLSPLSPSSTLNETCTTSSTSQIFHIYHTKSYINFTISRSTPATEASEIQTKKNKPHHTLLYYVKNSYFTPGAPDLVLHAGPDEKAPIISVCKFVLWSTDTKIGLVADPTATNPTVDESSMVWEDLSRESRDHSKYRCEINISKSPSDDGVFSTNDDQGPSPSSSSSFERRAFLWKRTHSIGVGTSHPWKISACNFKMVDEQTGEIVAVFANNGFKSLKKKGKLEIMKLGYGMQFEVMVLMSALALIERERRRSGQWRYDHY